MNIKNMNKDKTPSMLCILPWKEFICLCKSLCELNKIQTKQKALRSPLAFAALKVCQHP